jgi:hypothetical protein
MLTLYWMSGQFMALSFTFALELFAADFVLLFDKRWDKQRFIRLGIGIVAFVLIALFFPPFIPGSGPADWVSNFYEVFALLVFFFSSAAIAGYIFKAGLKKTIYYSLVGYNVQHLVYSVHAIINYGLNITDESPYIRIPTFFAVVLLSLVLMHFIKDVDEIGINNSTIIILSGIVLFTDVVLSSQIGRLNLDNLAGIIFRCYSLVCCLVVIFLQVILLRNESLSRQLYSTELMWEKDKRNYEIKKENEDEINIKYHDLKHLIHSFDGNIPASSLKEIEKSLEEYDSVIKTGSTPLDIVIAEKKMLCVKKDIRFTFMGDGESISFMEEGDVYSLFGNMLDNAIEATSLLPDQTKRVISLTISLKGEMICIQCMNYYQGQLVFNNGLPQTSKKNTAFHGYGVLSISKIVEKYKGNLMILPKDDQFCINILFSKNSD